MRVLLTGASGFIGRHLSAVLSAHGHTVVCAGRQHISSIAPPQRIDACDASIQADFTRDVEPQAWLPRLRGMDAVINAVGILREQGSQSFQSLHVAAPVALFDACVEAGVRRVIQISALGADSQAMSRYHLSKRRADLHLAALPLAWSVVQPSLVYGRDGESARLFLTLASLPWIPLPGRGEQRIQPIHIDDLTTGIAALLSDPSTYGRVIPFVGPRALTLRDYLAELRSSLGLGRARFVPIPMGIVRAAARLGGAARGSLIDEESLAMLVRGNTSDATVLRGLLGGDARPPGKFIAAPEAAPLRTLAQLAWLLPLLRLSIAIVWIVTGIVSLGLYPVDLSYQLLERVGVPRFLAPAFLYSAAALDLAFGLATLFMRHRRLLWLAQIAVILGYTTIITARMPEFWLHPYGPLLKNIPMLAAIYLLYRMERR
jgi:uncharacterized protein YbjT (DUF2867 family)